MRDNLLVPDNKNLDFAALVALLDADLSERIGAGQAQYAPHNKVDALEAVVLLYRDGMAVACGAFKALDENTAEVKRVFVRKAYRGQGLSKQLMSALERLIRSRGYCQAVLETGVRQIEAIHLYRRMGYVTTENYGPYVGNPNSVCMKKILE